MAELSIRGRRLAYEARPENFDVATRTVVFIHGSGGDREDWRGQLDGLPAGVNVVALELPGHGKSEPPGESTVPAYADWAVSFIEALGLKKVVLVGCSLGSAITQLIALSGNPWLEAIGLVGSGARLRVHPDFLEGLRKTPAVALDLMTDFALGRNPDEAIKAVVREKFHACSAELVHGDLYGCDQFDVMKTIGEIRLPTWILVGEDDRLTPVKYSRFLHENIAGSRLNIVPNAGHLAMIEKPEEFNRLLMRFLATLRN